MRTKLQSTAKRITIKLGTSLLADTENGLRTGYIKKLCAAIATLRADGRDVLLVSSGAIGAGLKPLGMLKRPKSLSHLQAAAAVGQVHLVHAYEEALRAHDVGVAQVLLTKDGLESRTRYLNARNTLLALLETDVVPIINENDTVSVDEIRFGDNDNLAALTTKLVEGDLLVILTDVDGLYTSDPRRGDASLIDEVGEITPELMSSASGTGSHLASGGMRTKLQAAQKVCAGGAGMVLMNGNDPSRLLDVARGEHVGTFFMPSESKLGARRFWIAYGNNHIGHIVVNGGARDALLNSGKSLLPVGALKIEGEFLKGDTVSIISEDGTEIARGISNYNSEVAGRILGIKSAQLSAVLENEYAEDELVHRDNIVML